MTRDAVHKVGDVLFQLDCNNDIVNCYLIFKVTEESFFSIHSQVVKVKYNIINTYNKSTMVAYHDSILIQELKTMSDVDNRRERKKNL